VLSTKVVFERVFKGSGIILAITNTPTANPITIIIVLFISILTTPLLDYDIFYNRKVYKSIRHYNLLMITWKDYELLTLIDKATPIKEIIKQGYPSSVVYNNLKKYTQNGLIIKTKTKPVIYDTTIKGGLLVFTLQFNKELLK